MAPPKILIVGCSIAGPTLASFLLNTSTPASEKPSITILERASHIRMQGQNIDVRGAGVSVIRKLGLETAIRRATTGEEGVQIVDAQNRVCAAFAADKTGKWQTPTSDIEILRGRLAEICYGGCKIISEEVKREGGAGVEFLFGDRLETLEQDEEKEGKVRVRFAKSGETRSFDLVVGADGLHSSVRKLAWGSSASDDFIKRLGMFGAFFSMPPAATDSSWRRWFRAPGRRWIMLRPDEQRGKTTAFLSVINEKDPRLVEVANKVGPESVRAQKELMAEYFSDAGWESERIVKEMMSTDDFYYDMVAQVKMDGWSKGRIVLLGDAGYCASPISGMGTTLALMGAYNLAGALSRHPNDHTAAFAEYEESMRPTVAKAQKLVPGAPHIMSPETAWGVWTFENIMSFLHWSRVIYLIAMFVGPPANNVPIKEFGFKQRPEQMDV